MKRDVLRRRMTMGLLFLLMAVMGGCSYFNAFYNTRKHFSDAERERKRATELRQTPAGYQKSVDAGVRLIELYPESKYVDDALFIMGRAYYWLQDYHKARRKFEEVLANFPDSPHRLESRLWLGRTMVKLKKRQEATSLLRGVIADTRQPDIVGRARFALAELYYDDSLFVKSSEEFVQATEEASDAELIGESYWRAGEALFREQRFDKAADMLAEAQRHDLSRSLRFQVRFLQGKALREGGEPERAAGIFHDLLDDKRYFEEHGRVRVHLGKALVRMDRIEDALEQFRTTIDSYPRSAEAAQAYYEMAMLNLRMFDDRKRGMELLDQARMARARSLYSMKADTLLGQLKTVDRLRGSRRNIMRRIELTEKWLADPVAPKDTSAFVNRSYYDSSAVDSLNLEALWSSAWSLPDSAGVDSLQATGAADSVALVQEPDSLKAPADSTAPAPRFDPVPVQDSLATMRAELQNIRFHLAEILTFNLQQPDSARLILSELSTEANQDTVRAKASMAMAYLEKRQGNEAEYDSLMHLVAERYQGTRFAAFARDKLGMASAVEQAQAGHEEFVRAETLYLAQNSYQEAYNLYRWIADTYPESPYAARSLYAAAYIAGVRLQDLETARELFDRVATLYPATDQAMKAEAVLSGLADLEAREAGADTLLDEESFAGVDVVEEDALDTPPEIVGGQEALASILEGRGLLPQEVMQGTGGEVLLRYIVDADGAASNFRVVQEDPPGRGLSRALITGLQEVAFRPGLAGSEAVVARVERRYTLPLDAPPNVRPLPKRKR